MISVGTYHGILIILLCAVLLSCCGACVVLMPLGSTPACCNASGLGCCCCCDAAACACVLRGLAWLRAAIASEVSDLPRVCIYSFHASTACYLPCCGDRCPCLHDALNSATSWRRLPHNQHSSALICIGYGNPCIPAARLPTR